MKEKVYKGAASANAEDKCFSSYCFFTLSSRAEGEDYESYFERLQHESEKAREAKETHATWKRRLEVMNGVSKENLKERIHIVLRELLNSDFLREDFDETIKSPTFCARSISELKQCGFEDLCGIEGVEWKYAFLRQHLLERDSFLVDKKNAGIYISEMYDKLNYTGVEPFMRYATFAQLVYAEAQKMGVVLSQLVKTGEGELFHFVHPAYDDKKAVHNEVSWLVKNFPIQTICKHLNTMEEEEKVLLPVNPGNAYAELVRIGMPHGKGFSLKNFGNYYKK